MLSIALAALSVVGILYVWGMNTLVLFGGILGLCYLVYGPVIYWASVKELGRDKALVTALEYPWLVLRWAFLPMGLFLIAAILGSPVTSDLMDSIF